MWIEKKKVLIPLSEAVRRFESGDKVLDNGGRWITHRNQLIGGYVYKEVLVEHPNTLKLGDLSVYKYVDGTHNFCVVDDYDVYNTKITKEQSIELIKFLAEPYQEVE